MDIILIKTTRDKLYFVYGSPGACKFKVHTIAVMGPFSTQVREEERKVKVLFNDPLSTLYLRFYP